MKYNAQNIRTAVIFTDTVSIDFNGLGDLEESLKTLSKKYPDKFGEMLVTQAKILRSDVTKLVKNDTDTDGTNKRSLANSKEYKISPVKGFNSNQFVEISGIAPHFHLVENGHQMVTHDGQNIGFVVGYHFFDRASKKREAEMPAYALAIIDKLLKEEGF